MDDAESCLAPPSPSLVTVCSASGDFLGTGFFVADRIVATCAHVVEKDDTVTIDWSGTRLTGEVLVRDPATRDGKRYYPEPDIAFVGVEAVDHPSAHLETSALARDLRALFIEGFSKINPNERVGLERRRTPVIGESGRYVLLDDTKIKPGMSGSPITDEDGMASVRGMLKSGRLAQGNSAYMIPAWEIKKSFRDHRRLLRAHMRDRPPLVRPRPGTMLHSLVTAQREAAERYPYQVAKLTRRDPPPLSAVYVEQRTRSTTGRAGEPVLLSPVELLHRHRNALIVGGPGGGKSTLLQQLVAASADWWLREPGGTGEPDEPPLGRVVAVRAAAQGLLGGDAWFTALARAVNHDLGSSLDVPVTADFFRQAPAPGADWLILVDGLDEVLDRELRRELIRVLGFRVGQYGTTTRFVVASRPLEAHEFGRLRSSLTGNDRTKRLGEYDLRPFDREAVQRFAGNWFRPLGAEHSTVEPAAFLEAIASAGLGPLVEVPLLATITAIVFEEKPALPLPLDRAGLYESFVFVLLTLRVQRFGAREALREQLAPLGRQAEDAGERMVDDRLACLSNLAVRFLRSGRAPRDSLADWFASRYPKPPFGVTVEHLRGLLLDTGLLSAYGDDLVFIHQSFAEYLASLELVGEFDPDAWLNRVRGTGPDSLGLFTLAAWGAAGNDTRPVIEALMAPGADREFPHLSQAAAVIQDGGVLAAGNAEEIIGLAETAVREVADRPDRRVLDLPARQARRPADWFLPAIHEALRAVLQRTRDTDRVARFVGDERLSIGKRAEAARVLLTSDDPADRETGLVQLVRLAYETELDDEERLWALYVIVDSGPPHERRHALQRLVQFVETAADTGNRVTAMNLLRRVDEMPAAAFALLRRALDPALPADVRHEAGALLEAYVMEPEFPWDTDLDAEPGDDLTEQTWSALTVRPIKVKSSVLTGLDALLRAYGPDQAAATIGWFNRSRAVDWSVQKGFLAHLARRARFSGQGRMRVRSEWLGWNSALLLASDPQAPWTRRLDVLTGFARAVPGRTPDLIAVLTGWLHDNGVPRRDRRRVLSALLRHLDDEQVRDLALDAGLPVRLRAVAAATYGVRSRPAEAADLLTGMAGTPGASRWTRWTCHAWRTALPLLVRTRYTG
jgi:hypothetical protein